MQSGRINLWNQKAYAQFREEINPFTDGGCFRPLNKSYTGDNTLWNIPSPEPELSNEFWELLKSGLNNQAIKEAASRLANTISLWEPDANKLIFVAILRAGVPIADWLCRLMPGSIAVSLSLFVGLGIDRIALQKLKADYPERKIVFIDGWTGRGGVARGIRTLNEGPLAVLIDPWGWADFSGSQKDIFCPSACFTGVATLGFSRTFYVSDQQLFAAYLFPQKYCRQDVVKTWQMNCPKTLSSYKEKNSKKRFFRKSELRLHSNEVCRALINAAPETIMFSDDPAYVSEHFKFLLMLAELRKIKVLYNIKALEEYQTRAACTLKI